MSPYIKVIQPSGTLDASQSQQFREKVSETIKSGAKIVLVNLKDVTFMDSSGLGSLVLAFKTLRAAEIKMVVCCVNEQIKILFELTGMDNIFEIFENQEKFNESISSLK